MKIAFLGNMNNLPYYIAKGLKQKGLNVTFIVDAEKIFLLDRPESWDNELVDKYTDWIVEWPIKESLRTFKFAFPGLNFKKRIDYLNNFDSVVLNGHWIALGGFLKKDIKVVNIFAGFDLDVLADYNQLNHFHWSLKNAGGIVSKALPQFLATFFFKKLISQQRKGIQRAGMINYYPTGINPTSDNLLNEIKKGQTFKRLELRGFDCDKFNYIAPVQNRKPFVILNITRFFYNNNRNSNKRNDIMIKGIATFIEKNSLTTSDLEIIFFNKGEDVTAAKQLCNQHNIAAFIKWLPQTTVEELKNYFSICDVAFDQLGEQWVGAGLFSMLTGRPLIANGRPEIFEPITGEQSPICQAKNAADVEDWLTKLYYNRQLVKQIGVASREYVLKHYNLDNTVDYFVNFFKNKTV